MDCLLQHRIRLLVVVFLAFSACLAEAGTVYVKWDSPGPTFDGSSWTTAFHTAQEGLNAAASGDEVWVAAGTYVECITLKDGVGLYGGFPASGGDWTSRDPNTNATVLDGNQAGSVVTASTGCTESAVIDGFRITNGVGSSQWSNKYGGGIFIYSSSPTVSNNTITGNQAADAGGGIWCQWGSPRILSNTISGNSAAIRTGGIHCHEASPEIGHNTLSHNNGAIFCHESSPSIHDNIITANRTADWGWSGIICEWGSCPSIVGNMLNSNTGNGVAVLRGSRPYIAENEISNNGTSGILCNASSPWLLRNVVSYNSSEGILSYYSSGPLIASNLVVGNQWGISCGSGSAQVVSNTILENANDGIRCWQLASPCCSNNIVASNRVGIGNYPDAGGAQGKPTISCNCVYGNTYLDYEGLVAGYGDVRQDPLFTDLAACNYRLSPSSPCIGAGNNAFVEPGWTDLDGNPRIMGGIVDMGAYEYPGEYEEADLVVDFSAATATTSMSGILHGMTDALPPDSAITPLRPHLWRGRIDYADRAISFGARYEFLMSESYGYPGDNYHGRGAPFENWTQWEEFVRGLAQQYGTRQLIWEVWNEPDIDQFWTGTKEQYFETYARAYHVLREELGPDALIAGPSLSVYDPDYIRQFLDYCQAQNCEVDVLTWHELAVDQEIPSVRTHLLHARTFFVNSPEYETLDISEIHINEIVGPSAKYRPGDILGYLYNLEAGGAQGACKGCWPDSSGESSCFNNTLAGLVTPGAFAPRAPWWTYSYYADGVDRRVASITQASNVVALGSGPSEGSRVAQVLVGAFDTQGATMPGTVSLKLKGLDSLAFLNGSTSVAVEASRIPDEGESELPAPSPEYIGEFAIDGGCTTVDLSGLAEHEAMLLTIRAPVTVEVNQAAGQSDPATTEPIIFAVSFSRPVTGFSPEDVMLGGKTVPSSVVVIDSGDHQTYTLELAGFSTQGTVTVSIPSDAAHDDQGNGNAASVSVDNQVTFAGPVLNQANGHYYEFVPGEYSWLDAEAFAETRSYQGMTGHLVTITSAEENSWVLDNVLQPAGYGYEWIWLGGFQDKSDPSYSEPGGGWRWITSEPWSFTRWGGGSPNDRFIPGEDYLSANGGYWNDNHVPMPFVIEYEPPDNVIPTVRITSPTCEPTFSTDAMTIDIAGTAADNVGVVSVMWETCGGAAGVCSGTGEWSASGIALVPGQNIIWVTAMDAAGNTATAILTIRPVIIVLTDGTFDDQDWQLVVTTEGDGGGTAEAVQIPTGGYPESYRSVTLTADAYTTVTAWNFRSDWVYDPSVQGAISYMDVFLDSVEACFLGAAVSQDGVLYQNNTSLAWGSGVWRPGMARLLTEQDFSAADGSHPDFSSEGLPICFGFAAAGSAGAENSTWTNAVDNFGIALRTRPPGLITEQPQSQTVCFPDTATFCVAAGGIPDATYQWRDASGDILGATDPCYTTGIPGSYSCLVSNSCVSVVSDVATLSSCSETIELKSGNAPIGSNDPLIRVMKETEGTWRQAVVCDRGSGFWVLPWTGTNWVSTNSSAWDYGGWYWYEYHFTIPTPFSAASIAVTSSADDGAYIYLNGVSNLGSSNGIDGFNTNVLDDTSAFRVGDNVLAFEVWNALGTSSNPTGLDFYAVLSYTPLPEPSRWEESAGGNGHYYTAVPGDVSWSQAKAIAENSSYEGLPGHLATITSVEENDFIAQTLPEAVTGGYWLGGYQDPESPDYGIPDAAWNWVTVEPWDYTNWEETEPNDYYLPQGYNENALNFYWRQTGTWNDSPDVEGFDLGEVPHGYVVEYEPDNIAPGVSITGPTAEPEYVTDLPSISIAGQASDTVGVTSVTWANDRGGSGTCSGTTSWSASGILLADGTNVITVTAQDAAGNTATDILTVMDPAPTVESISPEAAANTGVASVVITGTGFVDGASATLCKPGETDIAGTVTALSSTEITCTFDLTGKGVGAWDVVVINADGQSGVLPGAFIVCTQPQTPVVMDDGAYTGDLTELYASWQPVGEATEYQYCIVKSDDGVVVPWTSAGTATEVTETGLTLEVGESYYWHVKAGNQWGIWSEVGSSDGITAVREATIAQAKGQYLGEMVFISDAVVTSTQADVPGLWVESSDRASGLCMPASWTPARGNRLQVAGIVGWVDGVPTLTNTVLEDETGGLILKALSMGNRDLAPDLTETLNYEGVNPVGLLVTTWGEVTRVDTANYVFYVDDGTRLADGMGPSYDPFIGLRVKYQSGMVPPARGKYVLVTGIRSVEKVTLQYDAFVNGQYRFAGDTLYLPVLVLRDQADTVVK